MMELRTYTVPEEIDFYSFLKSLGNEVKDSWIFVSKKLIEPFDRRGNAYWSMRTSVVTVSQKKDLIVLSELGAKGWLTIHEIISKTSSSYELTDVSEPRYVIVLN